MRCALALASTFFVAASVHATPTLRAQATQHGDFALIGNTLAHDCGPGIPAPVVGTVGNCGTNTADTAPDVYWRSSDTGATADVSITAVMARSAAVLSLPVGARVTHAFLYWAATNSPTVADTTVTLDRPSVSGVGGFSREIVAQQSWTGIQLSYLCVADVTELVAAQGSGSYRVSGVAGFPLANYNHDALFSGWWMAVLYENGSDPLRSLSVHDGLDSVIGGGSFVNVPLSGFRVESLLPGSVKLGVVALEGDNTATGDQLLFNNAPLSDAQNPADNFFNGTRSTLGAAVSKVGDLPRLTGAPGSLSGLDIDVVDASAKAIIGQTSATMQALSSFDVFHLATTVSSIATGQPAFGRSTMAVADLNGGAAMPGDTLEYTIRATNDGNDNAIGAWLESVLPTGLTYVPGSIEVTGGDNAGPKTDAAGDDQAEYLAAERRIVVRLGAGANASQGGELAEAATTVVRFRATLEAACTQHATIASQATIHGAGLSGAVGVEALTDGNTTVPGVQPTVVSVDVDCLSVTLPPSPAHGAITSDIGFACAAGTCSTAVASGTTVNLGAVAETGYVFEGWSGDCAGAESTLALTMDGPKTCGTAFVAASHAIRVGVAGLVGNGLALRLNDSENLPIPGNGTFAFASVLHYADPYGVVIAAQPSAPEQACAFSAGTAPSGAMPDADVELALVCAPPPPSLRLTVANDRDHARYGRVVSYVVTLTNDGAGDASGLALASVASSQLDDAGTAWGCVDGGSGAICTASGTGALADSGIALPAGRSLHWIVSAPLRQDAAGDTLDYTVHATGAGGASATDRDILVLLRTGFDVSGGDGAE